MGASGSQVAQAQPQGSLDTYLAAVQAAHAAQEREPGIGDRDLLAIVREAVAISPNRRPEPPSGPAGGPERGLLRPSTATLDFDFSSPTAGQGRARRSPRARKAAGAAAAAASPGRRRQNAPCAALAVAGRVVQSTVAVEQRTWVRPRRPVSRPGTAPPRSRARSRSQTPKRRRRSQGRPRHPLSVDPALVVMGPATPYVEAICGPILFTAPHGLRVWRDGDATKVPGLTGRRVHLREKFATELVLRLARGCAARSQLGVSGSAVVWNQRARKEDARNLDPNYLRPREFAKSPWHAALVHFRRLFAGRPVLHVDLHGKKDRPDHMDIDVGWESLAHVWPDVDVAERFVRALGERLAAACEGARELRGRRVGVQMEPVLSGFWGHDSEHHTMTHQAALLGIPTVQLELPRSVRAELMRDAAFFDRFLSAITQTFKETVCRHMCPSPSSSASVSADGPPSLGEFAQVPGRVMVGGSVEVAELYARLLEDTQRLDARDTDRQI